MGQKPTVAVYRQYRLPGDERESCVDAEAICGSVSEQACKRGTFFMGTSIGQAMGLTMRGGTYFIDTATASQDYGGQCLGAKNVGYQPAQFQAGQAYAVYDMFANSETKVTYQIYVGSKFDVAKHFSWVRVLPLATGNEYYKVDPVSDAERSKQLGVPTLANGVLTVTIDQSRIADDFVFNCEDPSNCKDPLLCQPSDLCEPDVAQSKCVAKQTLPSGYAGLEQLIGEVCEDWVTPAYAEVDGGADDGLFFGMCPAGGCLGFSFNLPSGFASKPYAKVGQRLSKCYPEQFWSTALTAADLGQCPLPTPVANTCKD
jgi:hypothetical protein